MDYKIITNKYTCYVPKCYAQFAMYIYKVYASSIVSSLLYRQLSISPLIQYQILKIHQSWVNFVLVSSII